LDELTSFPSASHDDMVDAVTQALSYLRGSGFDSATFQQMGARQARHHAQRRRTVGYGQMIKNVADADAIEHGEGASGLRNTNPARLWRHRSAW
jgi:hypothetical protein